MNKLWLFMFYFYIYFSFSQTSIGNLDANYHARIDISAIDKGILIPRVSLSNLRSSSPLNNIVHPIPESLLIYNTQENVDVSRGYYYWQNNQWNKLVIQGDLSTIIPDGQDIISSHLDVTGGTKATLKEVNLAIKNNVISNTMLQEKAVTPVKISSGTANQVLTTNTTGTAVSWTTLAGDVTGAVGSTSVTRIQGRTVANVSPATNQVLKWNGTSWTPAIDAGITTEVDGVIGNEVVDATTNGGLIRSGGGTATNPYTLGITNNGVTTPRILDKAVTPAKISPGTANQVLTTNASNTVVWSDMNGVIPRGGIIMWSGSISTIPSGWAVCNGSNGTPNLTNRFIVAAGGEYNVNATGGQKEVTLSVSQMPSHSHGLRQTSTGVFQNREGTVGSTFWRIRSYDRYEGHIGYESTQNTGNNSPHENRPPYYALFYIMKL